MSIINITSGHINSAQSTFRLHDNNDKEITLSIDKYDLSEMKQFITIIRTYSNNDLHQLYALIDATE